MKVHYKIIETGHALDGNDPRITTNVLIERIVEMPGDFESIKAKFLADMPKIFPDTAFMTREYHIEQVI